MRLLADENMPLLPEFFAGFGELLTCSGRNMKAVDVRAADVLLVRSVTAVTRELLEGARLRWVGTATIGTDHLDLPALREQDIVVASAPGCNARAVGEYVVTALAMLAQEQGWRPQDKTLGIVGLGNTGKAVAALAAVLGFRVIACDPAVTMAGVPMCSMSDLLGKADIVTLHVPLTREGIHATHHLVDAAVLADLPPGRILLNCSRGSVVDNAALERYLEQYPGHLTVVLDVWEGEPRIAPAVLAKVRFGTPHVAGYSQEGKWRGTAMLYQALCRFLDVPADIQLEAVLPVGGPPPLEVVPGLSASAVLSAVLQQACPLRRDDAVLRASMAETDPAAAFDALRKYYPARREFTAHRVILETAHPAWPQLKALGFRPVSES